MAEDICAKLQELLMEKFRKLLTKISSKRCDLEGANYGLIAINSKGFKDCDAGFKADAHHDIPTEGKEVDVFLLNTEHFEKPDSFVGPLVVHELGHYLEQIGETRDPSQADKANAGAVLVGLKNNIRAIHTPIWAQHLVMGARRMVANGKTTHGTIREFLDAAVPPYDRNGAFSVRE
jgi:hypothetical protein